MTLFLLFMTGWLGGTSHVGSFWELKLLVDGLGAAGFAAAMVWALYLAVEPYMRRHWPDALISSTRLQAGCLRDTLVASHVLAGLAMTSASSTVYALTFLAMRFIDPRGMTLPFQIPAIDSGLMTFSSVNALVAQALVYAIGLVFVIVLLRLWLPHIWIADLLAAILMASLLGSPVSTSAGEAAIRAYFVLNSLAALWLLRRFGFTSALVYLVVGFTLGTSPRDLSTWYAGRTALPLGLAMLAGAWALWVILSAQRRPSAESAV